MDCPQLVITSKSGLWFLQDDSVDVLMVLARQGGFSQLRLATPGKSLRPHSPMDDHTDDPSFKSHTTLDWKEVYVTEVVRHSFDHRNATPSMMINVPSEPQTPWLQGDITTSAFMQQESQASRDLDQVSTDAVEAFDVGGSASMSIGSASLPERSSKTPADLEEWTERIRKYLGSEESVEALQYIKPRPPLHKRRGVRWYKRIQQQGSWYEDFDRNFPSKHGSMVDPEPPERSQHYVVPGSEHATTNGQDTGAAGSKQKAQTSTARQEYQQKQGSNPYKGPTHTTQVINVWSEVDENDGGGEEATAVNIFEDYEDATQKVSLRMDYQKKPLRPGNAAKSPAGLTTRDMGFGSSFSMPGAVFSKTSMDQPRWK